MKAQCFGILIFLIVLTAPLVTSGQPQQVASTVHFQHIIRSAVLGQDRSILIKVPDNYDRSDARYPVIYMLDAHPPQNAMMAGLIDQQDWGGMMPQVILVGIQNINRVTDMTPTSTGREDEGGAAKFLSFIETELMPFVEKNYRTAPYKVIAGHSLGGLFAVYALAERPTVFNAYVAASPVLHWDKNYVIKRAEERFKSGYADERTLFIGLGDEPNYLAGYNSFQDLLKKAKPKRLEYEFRQFKEENHGSVVLPAYYAGLRKVFAGWALPANTSVAGVDEHYKQLSARFGYVIHPPEATMNRVGYQLLNAGNKAEALDVFKKNAANYPRSANVYDSLAEAFEKNGQIEQAKANYEKAWKLAEQNGEKQLAISAKANFERITLEKK